jgi:hypothetical protein
MPRAVAEVPGFPRAGRGETEGIGHPEQAGASSGVTYGRFARRQTKSDTQFA